MSTLLVLLLASATVANEPSIAANTTVERLDQSLVAVWKEADASPAGPADDAAFLRRVWLDLAGRAPSASSAKEFLADKRPDKRTREVDRLLAAPHFANHWARVWTEYLTDRRPYVEENFNAKLIQSHIRHSLEASASYRDLVASLLCGEGTSDTSGPVNFLLRFDVKPVSLSDAVSKKFLGVTLHCAQCHDHPFAGWKQTQYWELAAFFGRTRVAAPQFEEGEEDQFRVVFERPRGELQIPDPRATPDENGHRPKKTFYPKFPDGQPVSPDVAHRREALVEWMASSDNPYFARHTVNQMWRQLFGSPLVTANFDKLDPAHLGPHLPVLDLLATDFAEHDFDWKHLLRTIVLSRAYQQSAADPEIAATDSEALAARERQRKNFARFPTKPLSADQVYLSVSQATGFFAGDIAAVLAKHSEDFPYDAAVGEFGEDGLSVQRSLSLLNSDYVRQAVATGAEATRKQFGRTPGVPHVRWLVLSTLSRLPTGDESEDLLEIASNGDGAGGLEDVLWVLLNSAEFNSNH